MTPELAFLSLLLLAINEGQKIETALKSEKYIEAAGYMFLTIIRGYAALSKGKTLMRNHFGTKVSSAEEFRSLLKEAEKRADKSVDKLFEEKGYSSYIEKSSATHSNTFPHSLLSMSISPSQDYASHTFKNLYFKDLDFSDITSPANFFDFCKFENCKFENSTFSYCEFWDTRFVECSFKNARMLGTDFHNVDFQRCEFIDTVFSSCLLDRVNFLDSKLITTNGQTMFDDSCLIGSISNCFIQNARFFVKWDGEIVADGEVANRSYASGWANELPPWISI